MTKQILNRRIALIGGALLVLLACFFVLEALLNYGLGYPALWQLIAPIFDKAGIRQLGWNINLLILFGLILAIVWNFFSVVQIKWSNEKERIQLNLSILKHWSNIAVDMVSLMILAILFAYLIGENCN